MQKKNFDNLYKAQQLNSILSVEAAVYITDMDIVQRQQLDHQGNQDSYNNVI